jgi:membrane-associated phospholipid phosphatase
MSVAVSRVLLGMHFVSDVIAGAVLGAALAFSSIRLLT